MSTRSKIFAVPFAGGSIVSYHKFKSNCPDQFEFCTLELPGRGGRYKEHLLYDMNEIVEDLYCKIVNDVNGPYSFFGHSMGGIIVYLLTQKLKSHKQRLPNHLFISGVGEPSSDRRSGKYLLPDDELMELVFNMGGTPVDFLQNAELAEYCLPVFRADFEALEKYAHTHSERLNIPITIFYGTEDKVKLEEVMGWQKETYFPLEVRCFSGGHFFINNFYKEILNHIALKTTIGVYNRTL